MGIMRCLRLAKIAYIRPAPFPPANEKVLQVLKESFPEHEVVVIDVLSMIKGRSESIKNAFITAWMYGKDIALGRKQALSSFFRTPYMFQKIKKLMGERISPKEYLFSFQIQSLFDASVPGVPHFVYTDHTHLANLHYAHFSMPSLYPRQWMILERRVYNNAVKNFTRSTNVSRSIIMDYCCPPEKVECVYAGSNVEIHENEPDYSSKNILFVGMDWKRKGGPELIQAFRTVRKKHPDAKLFIIGCEPKIDEPNCIVVGKLALSDVASYYLKSSIFCMPTKVEPFGIVFVEAISHGLPIVASDVGALPDMVVSGKNGYLVAPDDVNGIAKSLMWLLDDPSKRRMFGKYGKKLAREKYSWSQVGKRFRKSIIRSLADK
jgi:glycosyltransferase involved in cell wall biosynthesis